MLPIGSLVSAPTAPPAYGARRLAGADAVRVEVPACAGAIDGFDQRGRANWRVIRRALTSCRREGAPSSALVGAQPLGDSKNPLVLLDRERFIGLPRQLRHQVRDLEDVEVQQARQAVSIVTTCDTGDIGAQPAYRVDVGDRAVHQHVVFPALPQGEAFENAAHEGEVAHVQLDLGNGVLARSAEPAAGFASASDPEDPLWRVQCTGLDSNAKPSHPSI